MSNKKLDDLFKDHSKEEIIKGMRAMDKLGQSMSRTAQNMLKSLSDEKTDPEIRIIEAASLPAAYYMRDSVMEAIKTEILKDHKAGQPIPPGAELINQEDPKDGQAKEISNIENNNDERGDSSESNSDSENDAAQAGSSSEDHPGESAPESNDTKASESTPGAK